MFNIFAWGTPQRPTFLNDRWIEILSCLGLLLAAILLYSINLGTLPLRDWDEGIVAQVAREIGRGDWNWLHPTINDTPYLNKPPVMHWLIALSYAIAGVKEWTARWPSALLTAISVPLLYGLGRELFRRRTVAMFGALVYLTLLPVVRHGRLAMLDGAVVCFFMLTIWCLLRSRRDLRYALPTGISFGLLCLTKGIVLGLLLGAIAFLFILWDTPRMLTSKYLWLGLFIGIVPVFFWYAAQFFRYGLGFFEANLIHQSLRRVWQPVGNHRGPIWYYLLEIVELSWPWILFLPPGWRLAWENRSFSWGKLILVWMGVYLLAISLMNTKLPWYVLPIYPPFALSIGYFLEGVWQQTPPLDLGFFGNGLYEESKEEGEGEDENNAIANIFRPREDYLLGVPTIYHRFAIAFLSFLAFMAWAGCLYFLFEDFLPLKIPNNFFPKPQLEIQLMLAAVALTMTFAAFLLQKRDRQFLLILFWGTYISLFLFLSSDLWIWELKEDYAVKPVAEIIQKHAPPNQIVHTLDDKDRPSLNFYSDRQIKRVGFARVEQEWKQKSSFYLLVQESSLPNIALENMQDLGRAEGWVLVTRE